METIGYELRASSCAQLAATAAFTLLELLLVLVIVGLCSAIVAARLTGTREKIGVEMAAQTFVDQARRSQHLASLSGQMVRMRLDVGERVLDLALVDGVQEQTPNDGEPAQVALTHSADEMTIAFTRSDAVQVDASTTIDWIFTPDQRCDPAGIVAFTTPTRSASVQLSSGARLPRLITQAPTTP